jgi:hypothetical protein
MRLGARRRYRRRAVPDIIDRTIGLSAPSPSSTSRQSDRPCRRGDSENPTLVDELSKHRLRDDDINKAAVALPRHDVQKDVSAGAAAGA